jgi:hypothetical protein
MPKIYRHCRKERREYIIAQLKKKMGTKRVILVDPQRNLQAHDDVK